MIGNNVVINTKHALNIHVYLLVYFDFQDIDRWINFISELQFRNKHTGVIKRSLPFKQGWLTTLKAICLLITDLLDLDGINFVLTRRLNQDAIEVSVCNYFVQFDK